MTDIDEARDWLGNEIDCAACAHEELAKAGRCQLKHACVHDRYARRIDRFFDWNKDLANQYLAHPHFEVRAIAAKHAAVFLLAPLLDDPEETVRWNAARRLPKRHILRLRQDPHREVRIRIASLLDDGELVCMMNDPDYYVRLVIARRVAPALLSRMVRYSKSPVGRIPTQSDYADYRDVNGIKFPFKYTYSWLDGKDSFQLTDVKTNVAVDAAKFNKPATN